MQATLQVKAGVHADEQPLLPERLGRPGGAPSLTGNPCAEPAPMKTTEEWEPL